MGQILSHKLAKALATQTHNKRNSAEVTVEDLLNYLPMRYEDRSHPALIKDLHDGLEASLELTVYNAHTVTRSETGLRPFTDFTSSKSTASMPSNDRDGSDRLVVCLRPARLRDRQVLHQQARARHALHHFRPLGMESTPQALTNCRLNTGRRRTRNPPSPEHRRRNDTPDDLEQSEENEPDPALAAIHVGRRVPVYRKLGDFNSKRVREIVHAVLSLPEQQSHRRNTARRSATPRPS